MFDLEKAIAEWRRQMLAAGVKTPVPLDELESHLREEIERQIQSGAGDQEAFQRTVSQIGQAKELKAEFAKDRDLLSLLGHDKFTAIDRILGTLWLVTCSWGFFVMSRLLVVWHLTPAHGKSPGFSHLLIHLLQLGIYGAGVLGSVFVIRGSKLGRRIVGSIASLFTLLMLFILLRLVPAAAEPFSVVGSYTAFYAITAGLMFLPRRSNVKPAIQ